MRYPSVKTIMGTGCDAETARQIRKIMRAADTDREHEQAMDDIASLLAPIGMCGTEAIRCEGYHGRYCRDIHAVYCNAGDTYAATIVLLSPAEYGGYRWHVGSWGDIVERMDGKRGRCLAT